eukprot:5997802-Amphidinium_carterae.1
MIVSSTSTTCQRTTVKFGLGLLLILFLLFSAAQCLTSLVEDGTGYFRRVVVSTSLESTAFDAPGMYNWEVNHSQLAHDPRDRALRGGACCNFALIGGMIRSC